MGLSHEYNVARTHVRSLDFALLTDQQGCDGKKGPNVHLFETIIRYLGGFLSAYEYVCFTPCNCTTEPHSRSTHSLSGDELMLERAEELGNWLLPAFNTVSGLPLPHYELGS